MKTTPSCLYYYYCFYFLEPSFLSLSLSLASTEHPGLAAGPSMPRGLQQPPCTLPLLSVAGFCPSSTPNSPCHWAPGTGRLQEMALSCQMPWQSETKKKKSICRVGVRSAALFIMGRNWGTGPPCQAAARFPEGWHCRRAAGKPRGRAASCRPAGPSFQNQVPGTSRGAAEGLRMVLAAEHLWHTQTACGCCPRAASQLPRALQPVQAPCACARSHLGAE